MAKTREQQLKSVITYELEPEEVQKTLIKGVLSGFAAMNNAIIVDAKDLPKIINRQTFCLLTGIKPSKYYDMVQKGLIKADVRSTCAKTAYDVKREDFLSFYQQHKSAKQYELFR